MKKMKLIIITVSVCLVVAILAGLLNGLMSSPQLPETTESPTNDYLVTLEGVVYLGEDRVLVHRNDGSYAIWVYDRNVKGNADPLVTKEVWGTWKTIDKNHRLVYLGNDRVLDWEMYTGEYRIWVYDRSVTGKADPFTGPEVHGTWNTIKIGGGADLEGDVHDVKLIYLGNDRLLEWHDNYGGWWIWVYDRSVKGNADPIPTCEAHGEWTSITDDGNHELYYIGELDNHKNSYVLDIDQHGNYRVWWYDWTLKGKTDALTPCHNKGHWDTIASYGGAHNFNYWQNQFIYLGDNRLLIWKDNGDYRIYVIDRNAGYSDDPLPGNPEVHGTWKTIVTGDSSLPA